jgi:hypothetical protein
MLAVAWPFLSTRVIVTIAAWGLLTGILELVTRPGFRVRWPHTG